MNAPTLIVTLFFTSLFSYLLGRVIGYDSGYQTGYKECRTHILGEENERPTSQEDWR